MNHRPLVIALAILALAGSAAMAGTVTVTPSVVGRFAPDFVTALPFNSPGGGPITDGPGIYQVDFNMSTSNLAAGERGFANTAFDVNITGSGLSDASGWSPDASTVDSNGAAPGGIVPKWNINTDAGSNTTDLKGILASIVGGSLNAVDPRAKLGQSSPAFMGSVFLQWDGVSNGSVSLANMQYSLANTSGVFLDPVPGAGSTINFSGVVIPNPPVVNSLLIVNNVLNATVGGTVTATNGGVLGPAVLGPVSYTPGFGALPSAPGSSVLPVWDPVTGSFSWNTSGATRGTYVWNVNATNLGGTGNGTITVEQHAVPEPATLTLLGLAAVGLVGVARRRK